FAAWTDWIASSLSLLAMTARLTTEPDIIAPWASAVLTSHGPFALHRDAGAGPGVRPVIPHRAVLGAAIVPERDGVLAPAEAALEQRVLRVLVQIGEHGVALVAGDPDDEPREAAVDIERFLAGHGMGAHHRMLGAGVARLVGNAII